MIQVKSTKSILYSRLFFCSDVFIVSHGCGEVCVVYEVQSAPAIEYASRLERRRLHNGSARVAVLERELLEID